MRQRESRPLGPYAIDPKAFGLLLGAPWQSPELQKGPGFTLVEVRGAYLHHRDGWGDTYEDLTSRFAAACAEPEPTIVLRIDSPGGQVSGCFDAVRDLRAMAKATGKRVVSYIEGRGCSGGYALATIASEIVCSSEAIVGSIGVVECMRDSTVQDAAFGEAWAIVTSGKRKADGNPHKQLDAEAVAATQTIVNDLAQSFFTLVSEARGIDVAAIDGLEANIFTGPSAQSLGLVDRVGTWSQFIAGLNAPAVDSTPYEGKETEMDKDKLLEALQALLAESDEEAAAQLKAAIKALVEKDEPAAEEEEKEEEKKKDDPEASSDHFSAMSRPALEAVARAQHASLEASQKDSLLASRPDLSKEQRKAFSALSVSDLKVVLNPKVTPVLSSPAKQAIAARSGVGAPVQGEPPKPQGLAPEAKAELDARMGMVPLKRGVVNDSNGVTMRIGYGLKPQ